MTNLTKLWSLVVGISVILGMIWTGIQVYDHFDQKRKVAIAEEEIRLKVIREREAKIAREKALHRQIKLEIQTKAFNEEAKRLGLSSRIFRPPQNVTVQIERGMPTEAQKERYRQEAIDQARREAGLNGD